MLRVKLGRLSLDVVDANTFDICHMSNSLHSKTRVRPDCIAGCFEQKGCFFNRS